MAPDSGAQSLTARGRIEGVKGCESSVSPSPRDFLYTQMPTSARNWLGSSRLWAPDYNSYNGYGIAPSSTTPRVESVERALAPITNTASRGVLENTGVGGAGERLSNGVPVAASAERLSNGVPVAASVASESKPWVNTSEGGSSASR